MKSVSTTAEDLANYPDGSFDLPVRVKRRVLIGWARAAKAAGDPRRCPMSCYQEIQPPDASNCNFVCLPRGQSYADQVKVLTASEGP